MSRTYRRSEVPIIEGKIIDYRKAWEAWDSYEHYNQVPISYNQKRNLNRDQKPWYKPPKEFKTVWKRIRRAKVRNALRHELYDYLPQFKPTDVWDWT